jgi:hypothetical protein
MDLHGLLQRLPYPSFMTLFYVLQNDQKQSLLLSPIRYVWIFNHKMDEGDNVFIAKKISMEGDKYFKSIYSHLTQFRDRIIKKN